jgi:SAM-dependent methyltransferase
MFDKNRQVGIESIKSYAQKIDNGFLEKYLSGNNILEIGYQGYNAGREVVPIVENAIGIDQGYPGYDGLHLPFEDASQEAVYSSHVLEHIPYWEQALQEWFRVLKVGGFMVIVVPHWLLYEKKKDLPSRFAGAGHFRYYLPSTLLAEVQEALPLGEWRLRHMCDNDAGFDYSLPDTTHSEGCYEIECVIEKIADPAYITQMMNR